MKPHSKSRRPYQKFQSYGVKNQPEKTKVIQSSPIFLYDADKPGKIKHFKGKKLFSQTHEYETTPKKQSDHDPL